jgi:ATP-binding cassette, subfamily B, bacterial
VELRALRRGLALMARSSPGAFAGVCLVRGIGSAIPAALFVALGAVVQEVERPIPGFAPRAAAAVGIACLILVVGEAAGGYQSLLSFVVEERFRAALVERVLRGVNAPIGVGHLEDPAQADRLLLARWATQGPRGLLETVLGIVSWTVGAITVGTVASRLGWWMPLLILGVRVPTGIRHWRRAGLRAAEGRSGAGDLRRADYHYNLGAGMAAAREIRLFGIGDWITRRQDRFWRAGIEGVMREIARDLRELTILAAAQVVVVLVPFAMAFSDAEAGRVSIAQFTSGAAALAAFVVYAMAMELAPAWLRNAAAFLPEAFALADQPPPAAACAPRPAPPIREAGLRFRQVGFAYPGAARRTLDGLDLFLPEGGSLALVGLNGSGKSTIVKLICRLHDPDEGTITLDGRDLRDYPVEELRRRLAVTFQDFTRYPFSAAENIGLGCAERRHDSELLSEAAGRAGALQLVERLPQGWDTVLAREFGGVDLSGGEWQRVALARTMATRIGREPSLLVLDEPTAALDVQLEHDLYRRFASLTAGLTTLLISHRLSTVRLAERIAFLHEGRIVESGNHDQLLAAGGAYAQLYRMQSERFQQSGTLE